MYRSLCAAAFLLCVPLAATTPCVGISASARALYWKPCHDAFRYGIYTTSQLSRPPQTPLDLIPDYQWGWRISCTLNQPTGPFLINLEWAHVKGSSIANAGERPNRLLSQFIYDQILNEPVTAIQASEHTRYNKVSLKLGYLFCNTEIATIYGYAGGRWVDIAVNEQSIGSVPSALPSYVIQSASLNGGALEIGVGVHFDVWCGFGAAVQFGGLAVIGSQNSSLLVGQGPALETSDTPDITTSLRGLELRIAVDYTYTCCTFWVRGEIGYEMNAYYRALRHNLPQTDASNIISSNFTIGGPYAGITIGF